MYVFSARARSCESICSLVQFIVFAFLIILWGSNTALAQVYQYTYTPDLSKPCDAPAGNGEFHVTGYPFIDLIFDQGKQKLEMNVDIQPCVIQLEDQEYRVVPDGFWLVLNDGPNPKGIAGELAIIYVDGDRLGGGANPIATVYGYNGENGFHSYRDGVANVGKYAQPGEQAPDYILSSHPAAEGDKSWLETLKVEVGALQKIADQQFFDGKVSFHLVIDTSSINTHTPRYPDPEGGAWNGLGFGSNVGLWYHNMAGTSFDYCKDGDTEHPCAEPLLAADVAKPHVLTQSVAKPALKYYPGYIKNLHFVVAGWFDKAYEPANQHPYCITKFETKHGTSQSSKGEKCSLLEVGDSISALIQGIDDDKGKLTLTYSGQPDGAQIKPASGTSAEASLTASFQYQTKLSDQGKDYHVDFTFTDDYGAAKICPLAICVDKQQEPSCDLKISTTQPLQCTGPNTVVNFDATGSSDPDGDVLSYTFSTDCKDENGNPVYLTTPSAGMASLSLTAPGMGQAVSCAVSVVVNDGFYSKACEVPVAIEPCNLDCEGTPGGTKVPDACGVCGGDGTSCLDCAGTPNGSKVPDICGVCGGDGLSCVDCAGTPYGTKIPDECGVCGGDGSSCLGCFDVDISEVLVRLDSRSLNQLRLLQRIAKRWRRAGGKVKRINRLLAKGEEFHRQSWTSAWSIPEVITQCTNNTLCVSVDNTVTVSSFLTSSEGLRRLTRRAINGFVKAAGRSKRVRKTLMRRNNALHQDNETAASSVPAFSSACNYSE